MGSLNCFRFTPVVTITITITITICLYLDVSESIRLAVLVGTSEGVAEVEGD